MIDEQSRTIADIQSKLEKKGAADSYAQRIVYVGGRPIYMWVDEASEFNIDRRDINIATAVQLIVNALSGLPITIKAKDGDAWVTVEDHPALELLYRPNPFHNHDDIIAHIIQSLTCAGNSYFIQEKEKSIEYNRLWPVPPTMMQLVLDKQSGRPLRYIYDRMKLKIPFKLEEVFHIRWYHMSNPFMGSSMIHPAMGHISNKLNALEYNKQFFKNGASPEMVFLDKPDIGMGMTPEQREQFMKSWREEHKGKENAHKQAVLPPGIEPMVIGSSLKDMLFGEMQRLDREQIYGFLQIPPSEAGIYEYANYANALIQKKTFWENNLIPKKRMIETNLNRQIIWPQWGPEYRVEFDVSEVAALQEDKQIQATANATLYNAGIIKLNEARQRVGEEPIDGGDIFKPAPVNPFSLFEPNSSGDGGKNELVLTSLGTKAIKSPSPRESKWMVFDEKARREEPAYIKTINRFFNNQLSRVLSALNVSSAHGHTYDSWLCKMHYYKETPPDKLPDDVRRFFDITAEDTALGNMIGPLVRKTISDSGSSFFREYNIDLDFNVNNERVLTMVNTLTNRIKSINDTSYDYLRAMLEEAYQENWTLSKLEKEIRLQYRNWTNGTATTEARANMIARTETAAAVNGGALIGYQQGGVEKKEWLSSIDSATRDSHAELDGMQVGINERFANGLDYPGDPGGPPGEVINCRCTMIPVME